MNAGTKMEIASRLREARESAGLTQGQVARRLQFHRPTISEIEAGRRNVGAEELQQFANLYGVSTSWLLGEVESSTSEDEDRLLLAARELSKIKEEDLERLLKAIKMIRRDEGGSRS